MNRLIIRIFIGILVFFAFLTAAVLYLNKVNEAIETSTKLMLLPDKIALRPEGDQFYVYILLNSQINKIAAVDTVVHFDQNVLEVTDVTSLGLFATYPDPARAIDNKNGLVFLSAINYDLATKTFTEPFQNIGLYGRITFRVKQSLPTKIEFVYGSGAQDETNIIEDRTGTDIIFDKSQLLGAAVN